MGAASRVPEKYGFHYSKMKASRTALLLSALLAACLSSAAEIALLVKGEVKSELKLTLPELQALPNSTVTVVEREGGTAKYEGLLLHEILTRAGVPLGESLRGEALRLCVLATAADGYKAVFAIAELEARVEGSEALIWSNKSSK